MANKSPPLSSSPEAEEILDNNVLEVMLMEKRRSSKIVKVLKMETERAVPKGENFASSVHRVTFTCVMKSGKHRKFSLIVKKELLNLRAVARTETTYFLFRQETQVYTRILDLMTDLMNAHNDNRETLWAEFYGFVPYNLVVLEDLTALQYATTDRCETLDIEHVLLVLRGLGRFHAMSMVLLSNGMINENDRGKCTIACDNRVIEKLYESGLIVLSDSVEKNYGADWAKVAERLRNQLPLLHDKLKTLSETYDPKFVVLNHGDMWNCNVLFKHMEYTNTPISVKFVDFQVCHLNSFIWDITHFVNTCMQPKVLRDNKPLLLNAYQESLEKNLKIFNYDGYVPTYEDVKAESERLIYAEFALRVIIRPVITFSLPDAWDLKMLITKEPEEALNVVCFTDEKVVNEIKEDILWFLDRNVI